MYRISLCAALMAAACVADQSTPAPLDAGLQVKGTSEITETTTAFRYAGTTVTEQKSVVGSGESCGDAEDSSGTFKQTVAGDRRVQLTVMGNTVSHHPLIPGQDVYGSVGISVVNETVTQDVLVSTTEGFVGFDEDGDPYLFEETTEDVDTFFTSSRFVGRAVDEYHVELAPLNLFNENTFLECDDPDCTRDFDSAGGNFFADNEPTLLTMNNPAKGAIWTSLNGRTIYRFDGTDNVDVGGRTLRADRVQVFENGDFDADANEAATECVSQDPFVFETTEDDVDGYTTSVATLDGGCEDGYTYQETGVQWWYNGVLVRFEGRTVEVDVTDFGYEYYLDNDVTCTRQTSSINLFTDEDGDPDTGGTFFVEYRVTVAEEVYTAQSWEDIELSSR